MDFIALLPAERLPNRFVRRRDTRRVTYGSMLLEGVLAVFALACVAVLSVGDRESGGTPVGIFAVGASKFFPPLGVPAHLGIEFAMLAISTFLLTTLDTCTRLTRFLIEEFFNWRNKASRYLGTIGALLLPALLVFQSFPVSRRYLTTGMESNLATFWGNQSIVGRICPSYFRGLFADSRCSLWLCTLACCIHDYYAYDCPRLDVLEKWSKFIIGATSLVMFALGCYLTFVSWRQVRINKLNLD